MWWDLAPRDDLAQRPRLAAATGPRSARALRARTVVVGAGVAGLSLAVALARLGEDGIVVLEHTHAASGASGRNAGFLLCDSECLTLAAAMHGDAAAWALHEAGLATRTFVGSVRATSVASDAIVDRCGSVRVATDRVEARHFARTAALGLQGVRLETPPVAEAGGAAGLPHLAALADDGDGMLDPLTLLAALAREADARGVRRFDGTPVTSLRVRADGAGVDVRTAGGVVRAERVVVCTNADALRLVPRVLRGLRPVRAQALAARVDPVPPWRRPTYATRGGDYWRLLPDGRVLLGGMRRSDRRAENTSRDATSPTVHGALDALLRRLAGPAARIDVTHRWSGTMGFTPDGCPHVGGVTESGGRVHVLAGLNGHGMGWAPGLAAALAAHLRGSGPAPAAVFRPGRGPRRTARNPRNLGSPPRGT